MAPENKAYENNTYESLRNNDIKEKCKVIQGKVNQIKSKLNGGK